MDLDIDGLVQAAPLDWDEIKTALILAVGLWIATVEVLNVGPVVASGVVAAFATFVVVFLVGTEFE